jgi:transcriptional regulator with XRE-family HTH domain
MKTNLALKAVRKATGLTQPEFAKRLALSWRTVVSMERGERSLTKDTANRIMIEFGVLSTTLFSGNPIALDGEPYSPESFETYRNSTASINSLHRDMMDKCNVQLAALMEAAAERNRLFTAFALFDEWMEEAKTSINVQKSWREKLKRESDADPLLVLHGKLLLLLGRTTARRAFPRDDTAAVRKHLRQRISSKQHSRPASAQSKTKPGPASR